MSVTRGGHVREQGLIDRVSHLAGRANPAFAAGSLLVPLALVAVGVALQSTAALFYTHVAAGAVWFGFAVIFPAVVGPTLGALDHSAAADVTGRLTPKVVFLITGVAFATVCSGTALLTTDLGLAYGFSGLWPTLALTTGWGLFLFGLVVPNRLHLAAYYEGQSAEPDADRLEAIEKKTLVVGLFEAAVMLGIVLIMTGFRLGL